MGAPAILTDYSELAKANEPAALRILGMPFLEEVGYPDSDVVDILRYLARNAPDGLELVLAHPTLKGGITDKQAVDVFLLYLERRDPASAETIRGLPWVRDGIERDSWEREDAAVIDLVQIALQLPRSFEALLDRAWTRDGITGSEGLILNDYSLVAPTPFNDGEVAPLVGMPFLQKIDGTDAWLVRVLFETLSWELYVVRDIVARPEVQGGIPGHPQV